MLKSYRDLLVWQKAVELTLLVYRLSEGFPRHEIYGLRSQLRRASVSVPSNIAEGYGRQTRKDYVHFLSIAQGSLKELRLRRLSDSDWVTPRRHKWRVSYLTPKSSERCLEA
jgi:four helix bundle protein